MANRDPEHSRSAEETGLSRRELLRRVVGAGLTLALLGPASAACGAAERSAQTSSGTTPHPAARAPVRAELLFTFWGSTNEKKGVEDMVARFNASHPDVRVTAQHVPSSGDQYSEKMITMTASGHPPDVAYMDGAQAFQLASQGKLLDLTPYIKSDPTKLLPNAFYRYGESRIIGSSIGEITFLYYNKDLFDAAQLDYPPSKPEDAWTWDRFVDVARKLTKDAKGNDATSPSFDPDNIRTFGVSFTQDEYTYLPMIWSNGGRFANDAGTELLLSQPEAVEALQKLQDLIYKHRVSPTPAQSETMPSTNVLIQSRKVAMDINGHWAILDYSHTKGLSWDMAALPRLGSPATLLRASARVIFSATRHPGKAYEFYKYHIDPDQVSLFKDGLWMPPQLKYYKEPTWTARWLEGKKGVYPSDAKDVLVDYVLDYIPHQAPVYWLRNLEQIQNKALDPALGLLWSGKLSAQEAMGRAVRDSKPLMQGRWTK